jgi:DNA-binding LacI/PurR family transcriptional regulator
MGVNTTIIDVAKKAGVSAMTVSRALNNHPSVRAPVRQRILQVVQKLGYRPNLVAKALRSRSLDMVALVTENLGDPLTGRIVESLTRGLHGHGLRTVLCVSSVDVAEAQQSLLPRGVILVGDGTQATAARQQIGAAVAIGDRCSPAPRSPYVAWDFGPAYRDLGARLQAAGRRKAAYCCSPGAYARLRPTRFAHAEDALNAGGWPPVIFSQEVVESVEETASRVAARPGLVDAVICESDALAARLSALLQAAGVPVPQAVQVVGCDGMLPMKGLWTIVVDVEETARQAVRLLIAQFEGHPTRPPGVVLTPRLDTGR